MFPRRVSMTLTAVFLWLAFAGTSAAEQQDVLLLLQSSGGTLPEAFRSGLTATLRRAPGDIELFVEVVDANRFPGSEHEATLAQFLRSKYADHTIALAIAGGPEPLAFLVRHGASLFPGAPVVFAGVRESSLPAEGQLANSTGIVSNFDVTETLRLALALQPDARHLTIVSGVAPLDVSWNTLARERLRLYGDRLQVSYLTGKPITQLLEDLARVPSNSIVIQLSLIEDGAGQRFIPQQQVVPRISVASSAPVYGVYESYVGNGIVGGYVDSLESIGVATGSLALRILAGENASDIPIAYARGQFRVDSRQLRRWGLDESRLPPGTVVSFREPSIWGQYKTEILGVIAVVALQTMLLVALLLRVRKRRVELALRQSEDRYRNVVEAQTDLICRYSPDTTLTFVNDTYCRYFGRTREELIGSKFIELMPEAERSVVFDSVQSLLSGTRTEAYVHEVLKPDGSTAWQHWIDQAIVDANNRVVEIQGIGRDITQQKLAEIEALQRREQVTHLTRVAILGELSGALAHELNQPLTAILSNAQTAERLLAREPHDLAEVREILKDIVVDDIRAGEVIRRLRVLLKRGSMDLQLLDLNGLTSEALTLFHAQLVEQRVEVVERFAPALPAARGDRVQLQQVLLNLLMNACEAMSVNAPTERVLCISTGRDNDGSLLVSVSDNGPGIPPEAVDRLFEPFFTTKSNGLGLGLSICRSIIATHSGRLSVRNNKTGGAIVEFALSAHEVAAEQRSARPIAAPAQRQLSD